MIEGGEAGARPLQRQLPGRRQRDAARGALHQRDAECLLEVLHHLRDRRLGEIEDVADRPQRTVAADQLQQAQMTKAQTVEMLGREGHKRNLSR